MSVVRTDRGLISEWWWTIDRWLLAAFLSLMVLGVTLSFAASPAVAEQVGLDPYHFVTRQIVFMIPASIAMIAVSFLSPRYVRRLALAMLIGSLVAMVLVLFIGMEVKGSRRWLYLAGLSVQPSEYLKPSFIVICAWLFSENGKQPVIPCNLFAMFLLAVAMLLLIGQPDLGQTMLVTASWCVLFFLAGLPWLWIVLLGAVGAGGAAAAYFSFSHVNSRVNNFLSGEGDNYQVDQGLSAIMQGGWFGKGPGEGIVKRALPDSHTDFTFAVAAEEFGIVFCLLILSLFALVVLRGFYIAFRERDEFNRLAIAGLVTLFGLQSIINIGVNIQLLPAKGMTLPFISYGGSSLIATAIGMGMVLALSRNRPEKRTTFVPQAPRSWTNGVVSPG